MNNPDVRWRQRLNSFKNGLITDGETWMDMIASRNQTSHTYNQETADEIVGAISSRYFGEFSRFLQRFTEIEEQAR